MSTILLYNDSDRSTLIRSLPPMESQLLGPVENVLSCTVERDTEGLFHLDMTVPISSCNGANWEDGYWLYAPVGGKLRPQFFRICEVTEAENQIVSIHACHITYNANAILAAPFTAQDSVNDSYVKFYPWSTKLYAAIDEVSAWQRGNLAVSGYTDRMPLNAAIYREPVSLKQAVADAAKERSVIILAGDFTIRLWQADSPDGAPSFVVRYGENMLTYSNDISRDEIFTHVYPYVMVDDTAIPFGQVFPLSNLPSQYQNVRRIMPLNMSGMYGFESNHNPPLSIFRIVIDMWLEDHPFDLLPNTLEVSVVPGDGNVYELGLVGDIFFAPGNTRIRATIVGLVYDVLADRVTRINVNKPKRDITDTIAQAMG